MVCNRLMQSYASPVPVLKLYSGQLDSHQGALRRVASSLRVVVSVSAPTALNEEGPQRTQVRNVPKQLSNVLCRDWAITNQNGLLGAIQYKSRS